MSNYPTKNGVEEAEALDFTERTISISTTVQHRGRAFTVNFSGFTLDQAVDILDRKGYAPVDGQVAWRERRNRNDGDEQPQASPQPLSTPPLCPVHRKPMKEMKYPSKQGHTFHCTVKMDQDTWCDERA